MPVTASARKALRRDQRRAEVNRRVRQGFRKVVKRTRTKPTAKNLGQAYKFLDRAAQKKVIHKNRAARLKSRLSQLLKKTLKH